MKINVAKNQEDRILALAQERDSKGFYVYELIAPQPQGLGIAQYNARIKGLRKRGYDIKNVVPGFFVLLKNPLEIVAIREKVKEESKPHKEVKYWDRGELKTLYL